MSLILPISLFISLKLSACDDVFLNNHNSYQFKAEANLMEDLVVPKGSSPAVELKNLIDSFEEVLKTRDAKKISAWIDTPSKAVYAYGRIIDKKLMAAITSMNRMYKRAYEVADMPGEFVTFSFEKETYQDAAGLYFKPKEMTMSDWEMTNMQFKTTYIKKKMSQDWINDGELEFTDYFEKSEFSPHFLGKPTTEWVDGKGMLEIKHHSYEIDLDRVYEQANLIAKDLGETHSFHFHAVFRSSADQMEKYKKEFIYWYQQIDEYILLKGLEEGMHPSTHIEKTSLEESLNFNFNRLGNTMKFRSVGLRSRNIYNIDSDPDFIVFGLELRDSSRIMKNYKNYLEQIANSLSKRVWEGANQATMNEFRGVISFLDDERAMSIIEKNLQKTYNINPTTLKPRSSNYFLLPLIPFEDFTYMNYSTNQLTKVDVTTKARILQARGEYLSEVKKLEEEIQSLKAKGQEIDRDDVASVLKMELANWAKKAKVADLLKNFTP